MAQIIGKNILPFSLSRLRLGQTDKQLLVVWLLLRIVMGVWAAVVSTVRPITEREQDIALWPPSTPLFVWIERVLLAPWQRWDIKYYLWIVERGYRLEDGTAQFHPLLPWMATPIAAVTGQPLFGLMAISTVASVLLPLAFYRLALVDVSSERAVSSTVLLLLAPPAFVLFAPYTEGLWLLCAVLCLLCARNQSWWLAGMWGGLATLTRQQGVFLVLPLAWELWEAANRDWRRVVAAWRNWLALAVIPAGLFIWIMFRAFVLSDIQSNMTHPQQLIYSFVISSSASKVVPVQGFLWPWQSLATAVEIWWGKPELSLTVDLVLGSGFLVLLALAWPRMRISYRIYCAAIMLVSFAYYTGPIYPYMGLPRHLLLAFPVFIGLSKTNLRSPLQFALGAISVVGSCFLLFLYVLESWTP